MRKYFYLIFLIALSCIDRYNFTSKMDERLLAVEGFITTSPGVHEIKLRRTEKYGLEFIGINRPESLATVLIKDDLGRVTKLTEHVPGTHSTEPDFAAEIGRTYNLEIILNNGKRYISLPEKVLPVPRVDSVTYAAVRIVTSDRLNDEIGVQVNAYFQDPVDEENFYFWNLLESDFALITDPDLYHNPPTHPTCPGCPAPKPCCARCYHKDTPMPPNVNTVSDVDFNGIYQNRKIAYVVDNGLRFKETYRLDIQHLAVSAETHRFLKLVNQQISLTGSIFDLPPANIRGNFVSLDNDQEVVMGHFFASDVQLLRVYIHKANLEFYARPPTKVTEDCREYLFDPLVTYPKLPVDPPSDWNPE